MRSLFYVGPSTTAVESSQRWRVRNPRTSGFFVSRGGRESLQNVMRFEERGGRIARIRSYGFCPDTIRAVGEALGVRVFKGIYRAPTPAPGARWPDPPAAV